MSEIDALVREYSHLKDLPREKEALHTLKKIASLVKPIMRARNWKVGVLTEFYPTESNLLGLNVNKGQKICLRLRHATDKSQFLPIEMVLDTMLHELAHNVVGPHNEQFHALWDQQRKEMEDLQNKGYTGEGFMSEGHRLGGRGRIPIAEAQRIARAAAEKRRNLYAGSGQKLGGRPVLAGTDIRQVIVAAIERRRTVLKGCEAGENMNEKERNDIVEQATRNGFKTQAAEDEANERAIQQAMWELVQEDQKKEYGDDYIASTPANPSGNGAGKFGASQPAKAKPSAATSRPDAVPPPPRQPPKHVSRLVANSTAKKPKPVPKKEAPVPAPDPPSPDPGVNGWTCDACTLHNPLNFLSCDACTAERPPEVTQKIAAEERKQVKTAQPLGLRSSTWTCRKCTTRMENNWWTCSTCGAMKASS
ncbi:DNA-dependent metalloprotease WSS1 [Lachnellula suecica]|uniref:DNA-dependent metalloprotease WSS1 n=1 Tax=Lachnellula suecica TaxID=602035 RepID=A0A8T9BZC1_9HELO|nr:DNA-dependent metalloprotease WSS1 [Lachnellula suecica]